MIRLPYQDLLDFLLEKDTSNYSHIYSHEKYSFDFPFFIYFISVSSLWPEMQRTKKIINNLKDFFTKEGFYQFQDKDKFLRLEEYIIKKRLVYQIKDIVNMAKQYNFPEKNTNIILSKMVSELFNKGQTYGFIKDIEFVEDLSVNQRNIIYKQIIINKNEFLDAESINFILNNNFDFFKKSIDQNKKHIDFLNNEQKQWIANYHPEQYSEYEKKLLITIKAEYCSKNKKRI